MSKIDVDVERFIELLCYELAFDNLGVYPKARIVNGKEIPRTEWQDGWNACGDQLIHDVCKINAYVSDLPPNILKLITDEVISVHAGEDGIAMYINCNDLFYWACADTEEISLQEIPQLEKALIESPKHGTLLWCCRKREMRPQSPYYTHFNSDEKMLFDAVGPERTDEV